MPINSVLKISALIPIILLGSCVQFKTVSLYDGVETSPKPAKPEKISAVVEPVIFMDDATDVWGLEKNACQEGELSKKITYKGTEAIHLKWDRNAPDCVWSGIGIGWDSYAGKDLSEIIDYAAIEFYVRTASGKMFGLPIVLTFEDYSGGMGFSYTGNKYFERYSIDEEWQKVVVPLNSFDIETEHLDFTNIKQLQLELQQSGEIYLDNIQLVLFEPQASEPWLEETPLPDALALPKMLFADAFINDNGWGLMQDECRDISITQNEKSEGNASLHLKWDDKKEDCKNISLGVSWNKWFPVDLNPILATASIQFVLKNAAAQTGQLPIKIGFEDYDRAISTVNLTSSYTSSGQFGTDWTRVVIPLSAIKGSAKMSNIKQMVIRLEGQGEVYIDNIQLVGGSGR